MTQSSLPGVNHGAAGGIPANPIAVIGMACKFPGADSLEEFWRLLDAGLSMVTEPPQGRFPTHDHKRSTDKSVFFGNFLDDIASFDNRFFKKSSREAASMDPQQRLLLEVAYQALESAGYFGPKEQDTEVGCFVGVCASDYNDNVASHPPNAFSTLGTLRAFLTGKISHYFGFSGPSVTFDTACSSSAVAIDAACKAILLGDCTSAIAGGVSIFTSPHFYQNLAAASFLSPTGATKSFDAGADGYCRGEGVGLVVLKSLDKALADGDNILGTILSTSVKQSGNQVPITVPHPPSQTALYEKVLRMAAVSPDQVSYLEAHGTGTPIGDPQEFQAIKDVFGTAERRDPLYLTSVKGNIGHTEGASGVAGLIKTLLMMQNRAIPRQGSYSRLNPKISLNLDHFQVPTETVPWNAQQMVACVNNYGAAGSIAAMVVKEAATPPPTSKTTGRLARYPLIVSANSAKSLGANCAKLRQYLSSFHPSAHANILADIAFNLSTKQNRSLPNTFVMTISSLSELDDGLRIAASNPDAQPCRLNPKPNPIVLAFGGQTSRFVGLNRSVYEASALLRQHLDRCDEVVRGLGSRSIYPCIFESTPIDDIVLLQTMQFALQYSCAQTWIDCGLKVDCVIGHSFGQLVALTVSGVFSLADGLKLVYGRALLMQDKWGSERGSMIALDADREDALGLIASVKKVVPASGLEIACYNGPRSHVLVGSAAEIDAVVGVIKKATTMKYKILNVTHGFHSRFCDSILTDLEAIAKTLTYNKPKIRLETASDGVSWTVPTPALIAGHTRTPVYFEDCIKRIEERYGSCTWLEAGSNSSVTSIVRRSLSSNGGANHLFCPVNLGRDDVMDALADTTANLWKHGHHVQFWSFHHSHKGDYQHLNLPPYQFEKTQHWLDFKYQADATEVHAVPAPQIVAEPEPTLITFKGFTDGPGGGRHAVFDIDPRSEEWRVLVKGHAVLEQPLCPAPLYIELALRAAKQVAEARNIPAAPFARLEDLEITSSLGVSEDRVIRLSLTQMDQEGYRWSFGFEGRPRGVEQAAPTTHAIGKVTIISPDNAASASELIRVSRLLKYQKFDEIAAHLDGEAVKGALVYDVFSRVVAYHDFYKGVRHVSGYDGTSAAQVQLPGAQPDIFSGFLSNPVAVDNFLQVPGLYANCLAPCPADEVYVCTQFDSIELAQDFTGAKDSQWKVYSTSTSTSDKEIHNDVYVLDEATGKLVLVAFGARFSRVRITSLAKVLSRANGESRTVATATASPAIRPSVAQAFPVTSVDDVAVKSTIDAFRQESFSQVPSDVVQVQGPGLTSAVSNTSGIENDLRQLLSKMTDIPAHEFQGDASLSELGIDSLMATEIVSEVDTVFRISIPQEHLQDLQTFGSLCKYIGARRPDLQTTSVPVTYVEPVSVQPSPAQGEISLPRVDLDSGSEDSRQHQDLIARLATLLGSHLECPASDFAATTNLADSGLDSLLCMELMSDMEKIFGVTVDLSQLTTGSTFGDLADIVIQAASPGLSAPSSNGSFVAVTPAPLTPGPETGIIFDDAFNKAAPKFPFQTSLDNAPAAFESIKGDFDKLSDQYQLTGFYENVFQKNSKLVLAYTVEAFADLGIDLSKMKVGDEIPALKTLPKHDNLRAVLYEVLREANVADFDGRRYIRSETPIDKVPSRVLFQSLVQEFPQHAKEHMLLDICGSELAKLMTGVKDPLNVLFGTKKNRDILEDVYSTSPMYVIMSQLLTSFLEKTLRAKTPGRDGKFRIIELGAGTGSTTKWVVERLVRLGIPIEYTFTDISSSLVAAGKRKFSKFSCMKYATINIEKEPPAQYLGKYDIVLSTNCIHATSNLPNSLNNISKLLQPNGIVALVEFTSRMFWFDLVFGLLEGWWLFNDGRPYVLASPEFWEKCMKGTGFQHVSWTGGSTRESEVVRVITGFKQPVGDPNLYRSIPQEKTGEIETLVFKHTDQNLPLRADIHYPSLTQALAHESWTVGLMIHGGGHVMLSRKDVRPRQTQLLLDNGVLPVAIDYRLCPEVTILEGPITDVSDAYAWARNTLPLLKLQHTPVKIRRDKTVVIGWSTGGTLAMSLAWTSVPRGLPAPDGILVFYCPTNYEDEFWTKPNIPDHSETYSNEKFNILEGVHQAPITSYNVPPKMMATAGWMTPKDARSRIILHMNWHGQTLPVLFNGLPAADTVSPGDAVKYAQLKQPSVEDVVKASPYAQIIRGNYKSPTHIIFGTKDDLIPWQQAQKTADALKHAGVESGLTLLQDQPHLFDMYRDPDGKRWEAVLEGYKFLLRRSR